MQPPVTAGRHECGGSTEYGSLFDAEERHFWFRARNRVLAAVVRSLERGWPAGYRVIEVGCGTGNVLRMLERECRRGEVIGLDLFEESLRFARRRVGCRLVRGDVYDWPVERPFNMIGMFDVLEHLPDDVGALRRLRACLAPGGRLVLTVPAHMSLWSYADTHARHYRRYGVRDLSDALRAAGFVVDYLTQFMAALFPLVWTGRRLAARGRPAHGGDRDRDLFLRELKVIPVVNGVLARLLGLEAACIARRWRLPVGTSLLAVARPAETAGTLMAA
jgi:SAM-dependent methyltransferase